jgi:hypothetical protein
MELSCGFLYIRRAKALLRRRSNQFNDLCNRLKKCYHHRAATFTKNTRVGVKELFVKVLSQRVYARFVINRLRIPDQVL